MMGAGPGPQTGPLVAGSGGAGLRSILRTRMSQMRVISSPQSQGQETKSGTEDGDTVRHGTRLTWAPLWGTRPSGDHWEALLGTDTSHC